MALRDTVKSVLGSAWHVASDAFFAALLPATDGVVEAGKALVPDANKKIDVLEVASLKSQGNVLSSLPAVQYSTAALQAAVMPAANLAGADEVDFENTGTTPGNLQFDTAANIIAAIPNAQVGQAYRLRIRNSSGSANTATITTNTGVTLTGTMTIAQNVTRDFVVTLTSLTAITVNSMGVSAAAA